MSCYPLVSPCLPGSSLSLAGEGAAAAPDPSPSSSRNATARLEHWLAQVPPWLKLGAEIRGRSDNYFGLNALPGRDGSHYLHRLRLKQMSQESPALGRLRTPVSWPVPHTGGRSSYRLSLCHVDFSF